MKKQLIHLCIIVFGMLAANIHAEEASMVGDDEVIFEEDFKNLPPSSKALLRALAESWDIADDSAVQSVLPAPVSPSGIEIPGCKAKCRLERSVERKVCDVLPKDEKSACLSLLNYKYKKCKKKCKL